MNLSHQPCKRASERYLSQSMAFLLVLLCFAPCRCFTSSCPRDHDEHGLSFKHSDGVGGWVHWMNAAVSLWLHTKEPQRRTDFAVCRLCARPDIRSLSQLGKWAEQCYLSLSPSPLSLSLNLSLSLSLSTSVSLNPPPLSSPHPCRVPVGCSS